MQSRMGGCLANGQRDVVSSIPLGRVVGGSLNPGCRTPSPEKPTLGGHRTSADTGQGAFFREPLFG